MTIVISFLANETFGLITPNFHLAASTKQRKTIPPQPSVSLSAQNNNNEKTKSGIINDSNDSLFIEDDYSSTRRNALLTLASATTILPLLSANAAIAATTSNPSSSLETLSLGQGQWTPKKQQQELQSNNSNDKIKIPASFCTYASRFLLQYDTGAQSWWNALELKYSLLSEDKRQMKLGRSFGSFTRSLQLAMEDYYDETTSKTSTVSFYNSLWDIFVSKYVTDNDKDNTEIRRQLSILFALLPPQDQPISKIRSFSTTTASQSAVDLSSSSMSSDVTELLANDLTLLLPKPYHCIETKDDSSSANYYTIEPLISTYEIGIGEELGQTAVTTPFGPLSLEPLGRESPQFSPFTYGLFALSGSAACAVTHSFVIPLDVVKTRAQTNPEEYTNIFQGVTNVIQGEEGIQGLFLGAQATLVGYFWYGLSIYPTYAFLKRFMTQTLLSPDIATLHMNDIALVGGALSAVVASIGLTPIEAARIRVVAEPDTYKSQGLLGTMAIIAKEDPNQGWKALYSSFPSLLTRQVIFGSVKFLAFERTCEVIYAALPSLRDATWTALTVSLLAGGVSGALSSVVSQPADSVLTYVAKSNSNEIATMEVVGGGKQKEGGSVGLGVIEGSRIMIEKEGWTSLFRGLGSRCIWSGSIIAGQFLLYDVFRTTFGVNSDALSQIYNIQI